MFTHYMYIFFISVGMILFSSCGIKDNEDPIITPETPTAKEEAVSFSSSIQEGEEQVTRAESPLNQNFIVYGYKNVSTSQIVFNRYTVKYTSGSAGTSVDNTNNYSYVDPTHNQEIKFWDYSASEYRYFGYVPNVNITDDEPTRKLTVSGLKLKINEPTNYLVSTLKIVPKSALGDVVQMHFRRPYAQVRVMVYSGEKLEPPTAGKDGDAIELTNISFGPSDGSSSIVTDGTITIQYPLTTQIEESYTINATSTTDVLQYKGFGTGGMLTLTSAHCASNTAAVAYPKESTDTTTPYYYVFPLGTSDTAKDFTFKVYIDGDDEAKTAIVPAIYMNWQPNHSYTYIFKILEGGLIFVDAKTTEWQPGGSVSQTWPNW